MILLLLCYYRCCWC